MRVYDLAKELGKDSSKEVLDILGKHDINLKSSSNITDEQASIVKKEIGGSGHGTSPVRSETPASEDSEAPKKKIAAVFRPQNAQMKPQGQRPQSTSRPTQGGQRDNTPRNHQGNDSSVPSGEQNGNRTSGGYQGNRTSGAN